MSEGALASDVWLGLAGDLIDSDEYFDHYCTRVGGVAVLPASPPAWSTPTCAVCGKPLSLVLQAYAPHADAPERVLLLLGCTKLGCGKAAGCWQALRCQAGGAGATVPLSPQPAAPQPGLAAPTQQPQDLEQQNQQHKQLEQQQLLVQSCSGFDAAASSDWGMCGQQQQQKLDACPGFDADAATSGGMFDFSDLTSTLESTVVAQTVQHSTLQRAPARSAAAAPPASDPPALASGGCHSATLPANALGQALPCFHVYSELEPGEDAAKALRSGEAAHLQQLLEGYYAAEAAAGGGDGGGGGAAAAAAAGGGAAAAGAAGAAAPAELPGGCSSSGGASCSAAAADEADGAWAGEQYERDELRGVDGAYLKFAKRLARRPQQCARYCPGGAPLWPSARPGGSPPPCGRCGGPRVFELQLMAPLIQLVIEAGQMAAEAGASLDARAAAAVDAVANWDWVTVAAFTCAASCGDAGSCVLAEEHVVIVLEHECHTELPGCPPTTAASCEVLPSPG